MSAPRRQSRSTAMAVLAVLALALRPSPPLLCNPFDIGSARSLPWDGTRAFWQGRADYRLENLVADTEALLTPSTPVIVRMETLRRAAIYASADGEVAKPALCEARRTAASVAQARRTPRRPRALRLRVLRPKTYRQIAELDRGMSEFRGRGPALRKAIGSGDGYALIKKTFGKPTTDPAVEFAAALMIGRRDNPSITDPCRASTGRHRPRRAPRAQHQPHLLETVQRGGFVSPANGGECEPLKRAMQPHSRNARPGSPAGARPRVTAQDGPATGRRARRPPAQRCSTTPRAQLCLSRGSTPPSLGPEAARARRGVCKAGLHRCRRSRRSRCHSVNASRRLAAASTASSAPAGIRPAVASIIDSASTRAPGASSKLQGVPEPALGLRAHTAPCGTRASTSCCPRPTHPSVTRSRPPPSGLTSSR